MLDGICVRSIPTAAMCPCKGDMSPVSPAGDQPLSHLSWVENERLQAAPAPGMTSSAIFCSFALFLGFQLRLTSEGHFGQWKGVLDLLSPCPTVTHTGSSLTAVGPGQLSPAISHHTRGSRERCLSFQLFPISRVQPCLYRIITGTTTALPIV